MPLFTAVVVTVFGILTIMLDDERFIKMKPTIVNVLFAFILWGGLFFKKNFMQHIFGKGLKMKEAAWRVFTIRWSLFFIFLAILNEYIWRNFSTDHWVQFKVFGLMGLSFLFVLSQVPFLQKNAEELEGK
jgi:intracellular septation protein